MLFLAGFEYATSNIVVSSPLSHRRQKQTFEKFERGSGWNPAKDGIFDKKPFNSKLHSIYSNMS